MTRSLGLSLTVPPSHVSGVLFLLPSSKTDWLHVFILSVKGPGGSDNHILRDVSVEVKERYLRGRDVRGHSKITPWGQSLPTGICRDKRSGESGDIGRESPSKQPWMVSQDYQRWGGMRAENSVANARGSFYWGRSFQQPEPRKAPSVGPLSPLLLNSDQTARQPNRCISRWISNLSLSKKKVKYHYDKTLPKPNSWKAVGNVNPK